MGEARLSFSIVRKTKGDLVVANYAIERWFQTDSESGEALERILAFITEYPVRLDGAGEDDGAPIPDADE